MSDQLYINFDEYIRQGEPAQRERADAWRVAIGLQAVDGLKTSEYLHQTARRNIEGEITIDEARELVKQYYVSKTTHDEDDADKEEADRVSGNIAKLLQTDAFTYSVAGLWQIHPFAEGNTRTTAVFTIKYLRYLGFSVNNDLFERHSWYFRNALVRANYRNVVKGVEREPLFLIRFFRNLLLGENNELKNRYMMINPPEGHQMPENTPQVQDKHRTSTGQVQDKIHTDNYNIIGIIKVIEFQQLSVKEIMTGLQLKGRDNFLNLYLLPAIAEGYVRLLYPDKPRHPRQKYLLTVKGLALYNEMLERKEGEV